MLTLNRKFLSYANLISLLVILLVLSACTPAQVTKEFSTRTPLVTVIDSPKSPSITTDSSTQNLTATVISTPDNIISPSPTVWSSINPVQTMIVPVKKPTPLSPDAWMSLPIIPTVSETARMVYQHGLEMGNDPHAFSKIGDCQSISTYFLSYFDLPGYYNLGNFTSLKETIDWYSGSFSRDGFAVKGGFNAAAVLSPLRSDPKQCNVNESPIACEFRLHHPSIAIISLEEWWSGNPENYSTYMRQIIEFSIEQGVVPIIATKADNLEGNNLINQTIANLAMEYDIPLWNFWSAVQPLPNHGLIAFNSSGEVDMFHLTHSDGYYFYNDPIATQSGWSIRNLTALQALDVVRRGLSAQP
jgi:hypothetical protein